MTTLKQVLLGFGIEFENDKIKISENIKKLKFDIGISTEAIHTEHWLNHDPDDLCVFGFEPLSTSVEATRKYYSQPNSMWKNTPNIINLKWLDNNFHIIPIAIGNTENNVIDFFVTDNDKGCSSIYPPSKLMKSRHNIALEKIIQVPIFKLSDFFDILPLERFEYIEYIKVDVQGSDLDVIRSGGNYISEKVVFVTLEPEMDLYDGANNNSISQMILYMNSIGFDYIRHENTCDPTFLNRKFAHLSKSIFIKQFN